MLKRFQQSYIIYVEVISPVKLSRAAALFTIYQLHLSANNQSRYVL